MSADEPAAPQDGSTEADAPVTPGPIGSVESAESARRAAVLAERARERATEKLRRAEAWVAETDQRRTAWDTMLAVRDRDRDAFASVLGSAIALRLFLFSAALVVALVSAANLILGRWGLEGVLDGAGLTAEMAQEVSNAARPETGRDLGVLLSSTAVALWAGRSLTLVLAACSAGGWRMHATEARASVGVVVRVTGLVSLVVLAASLLARLRAEFGVAVATGSLALTVAMLGVGWFFVTLALPRPTRDPGALLPGAVVFGVVLTLVQWFMHYYLPFKIESASDTMGSLSTTVASLGYLFVIGRVMAGTVVLNAVLYEQIGSISVFVFQLPGLRRIPERFPQVATFFDLDHRDVLAHEAAAADAAGEAAAQT